MERLSITIKFGKIEAIINYDGGRFEGKSTMYHPIQSADETPTITLLNSIMTVNWME